MAYNCFMYPAVYSYKKSRTRELELSIETLKNIKEWNGEVIVVGDKPNLDIPFTHLTIKYTWGKGNKATDETCAYLTACDEVGDFILMSDDLFILKPWSITRHNRGTLEEHSKSRRFRDSYSRQLDRTKAFLDEHGKPTLSYELHIPLLVKAEELKEVEKHIPHNNQGVFIRSVIGNWFNQPSIYLDDPKNKPLSKELMLYSSSDTTFNYDDIKKYVDLNN